MNLEDKAYCDAVRQALTQLLEMSALYRNVRIVRPESLSDSKWEDSIARTIPFHLNLGSGFGKEVNQTPLVNLECDKCKATTAHTSHAEWSYGKGTETHCLRCTCGICGNNEFVLLVREDSTKLQIVGRTKIWKPRIPKDWPKGIREIIRDAMLASQQQDVPAGFYHLRTALEHYMKQALSMPINTKIDGQKLCDQYKEQLHHYVASDAPSVSPIYNALSAGLHERSDDVAELEKLMNDFLDHVKTVNLVTHLQSRKDPSQDTGETNA